MEGHTSSCTTMLEEHKFNFVWTIQNFGLHLKIWDGIEEEYSLESSTFLWNYQDSEHHLQLTVLDPSQNDDSGCIHLTLHSTNSKPMMKVKFSIICKDDDSLTIHRTSNTHKVLDCGKIIHGFSDSITQPEVRERLDSDKHDSLTINCKLTKYATRIWKVDVAPSQLQTDYAKIYEQQKNTDFTFFVADKKFPVHKLILKARSPVFAAMFTCKLTEQVMNKALITDIEAPAFEKLLEFIYTDSVTDMAKYALDLLVAADKYELKRLKSLCEKTVSQNIEVSNAAAIFIIAYQHSAKNLWEFVRNFIIINRKKVEKTPGFKELEKFRDLMLILYKQ